MKKLFRARMLPIAVLTLAASLPAMAVEITVQNDSITDLSSGSIQAGFVAGEQAAAWLDSPCDGTIVAVQVFWRSVNGGAPQSVENSIRIFDNGTFPLPGNILETISGPVMTDGVVNEFRFLDDQMVIPLQVPVTDGQTFVVSFTFENTPLGIGPSVVTDVDGCQAGRNGIFATPPNLWFSSCALGVTGDFFIRAVVDCPAAGNNADLSISKLADSPNYVPGEDLGYTITAGNTGPAAANAATIIDFFPPELSNIQWSCSGQGGAICPAANGSGNITQSVNLPVGGSLIYAAVGTVSAAADSDISNTAQIVVPAGITDDNMGNNTSVAVAAPGNDLLFADGFES